jgi:hypothetical protein
VANLKQGWHCCPGGGTWQADAKLIDKRPEQSSYSCFTLLVLLSLVGTPVVYYLLRLRQKPAA